MTERDIIMRSHTTTSTQDGVRPNWLQPFHEAWAPRYTTCALLFRDDRRHNLQVKIDLPAWDELLGGFPNIDTVILVFEIAYPATLGMLDRMLELAGAQFTTKYRGFAQGIQEPACIGTITSKYGEDITAWWLMRLGSWTVIPLLGPLHTELNVWLDEEP